MSHWYCPARIAIDNGDQISGPFQPLPILHQWWQSTSHWESMVMGPDCDAYSVHDMPDSASDNGIYMLFSHDERLLYVGKSHDMANRVVAHYRKRRSRDFIPFAHFAFLPLPMYATADVEVAHIYALKPRYNRLFERIRWGQHDSMANKIKEAWGGKDE